MALLAIITERERGDGIRRTPVLGSFCTVSLATRGVRQQPIGSDLFPKDLPHSTLTRMAEDSTLPVSAARRLHIVDGAARV
jgi:hypothetical protein